MIKTLSRFLILGSITISFGCQKEDIPPQNKVPIANAGSTEIITLPTNSVTLNGSGKDEDGNVVAYLWSQTSGPSGSNIENPGSASTSIKNFTAGTYIFQLMVTDDKGAVGVDTTSIVVKPSVIQTLTLQPTNNQQEYAIARIGSQDASNVGGSEISIAAWTKNSSDYILRSVFKFDLSTIPVNSNIISANLYLYSNPNPSSGNFVDANFGNENSLILQRVSSNWAGSSISWSNQPSTTVTNQITIPSTTQSMLDLNIDVKEMVKSMIGENNNFGFFLRLQNEVLYNSRIFISSYNITYPEKHPKLVIVYN